jgi:aspartyl-tRNA(Asn)/glutamyl-tRNA(Gln) amidotransferase subunit B
MEEGSLRCDANISIRLRGESNLGTKVEVKNLNSIRNVKKAIEFEILRMMEMAEKGERIMQQTRSFNADNDTTFAIRDKEEANDYRYFPEPDLTPFNLTEEFIQSIKESLPELPEELYKKYQTKYHLPEYDARQLSEEKSMADYFEDVASLNNNFKAISNWMLGPLRQYLNEKNIAFSNISLKPTSLAQLITLVEEGKINFSVASSRILPLLLENSNSTPLELATQLNLIQIKDSNEIENWVDEVINKMPGKVAEYKKGKKGLMGLFVGEVKKLSKGKADPQVSIKLFEEKLSS